MRRRVLQVLAGVAVLGALTLGAAAIAGAAGAFDDGDRQLRGPEAEKASVAALRATGGGTVNAVERDSEDGGAYEVEVTRANGSTVEVRVNASFEPVGVEDDSERADSEEGDEDGDGDADAGEENDADDVITGSEADRARESAVRAAGGGTAGEVERDSDNAYEVEVTRKDGSRVDVDLDESFRVVSDGDSD